MNLLPGVCQRCRGPVWWNGKAWVDGTIKDAPRHLCPKAAA